MAEYYLYRHLRTDISPSIPFYIGIGKKRSNSVSVKDEYKRAYSSQDSRRSQFWFNVFNKCHKKIEIEVLFESQSSEEIKQKEKEFIALYGRNDLGMGPLVNHTNGGDGLSGYVWPEHRKIKMSQRLKGNTINVGRKHSPETKAKLSARHKGRVSNRKGCKVSEEQRQQMIVNGTGRKHSQETKDKIGANWKGRKHSEESKRKISLSNTGKLRGVHLSEEHKRKIGFGNKGKIVSESSKEKMRISSFKRWHGSKN